MSWYLLRCDTQVRFHPNRNNLQNKSQIPQWRFPQRASQVGISLGSAEPLHNPHCTLQSCPQTGGKLGAFLPRACCLSFLLKLSEFRYLFPGSIWVVSAELSAILRFTGRYSLAAGEPVPFLIPTVWWETPAREEAQQGWSLPPGLHSTMELSAKGRGCQIMWPLKICLAWLVVNSQSARKQPPAGALRHQLIPVQAVCRVQLNTCIRLT